VVTIYTAQIAQWRRCKAQGIELIDTTVKSGSPIFAPTWEIVMGVKSGEISEARYTEVYHQLMRRSFVEHKDEWLALLSKEKIAIACYCKAGAFCHRHLLVEYLIAACRYFKIEYTLGGEV
jgi:uncharacterized protein YeaO (DUF488 family)